MFYNANSRGRHVVFAACEHLQGRSNGNAVVRAREYCSQVSPQGMLGKTGITPTIVDVMATFYAWSSYAQMKAFTCITPKNT